MAVGIHARQTYLLNAWQSVMDESIWLYNQISGQGVEVTSGSVQVYTQAERDYIASALDEAFQTASEYLGFYPRPTWVVDEIIPLRVGKPYTAQQVLTCYGYVEAVGKRAVTLIDDSVTVVYTDDLYQDQIEDTASVTITTIIADAELAVFFRVVDGAPSAADERWQIYPMTVTDNGNGTKTLTAHKALFVNPLEVWDRPLSSTDFTVKYAGDTERAADFVEFVDVYRVYNNPTDAVSLLSQPRETGDSGIEAATAWIRDPIDGQLMLYTVAPQDEPTHEVHSLKVSYKAGYPLQSGMMNRRLEVALVRLANTLMPQQPVMTGRTSSMWKEDNELFDEAISQDEERSPAPFGSKNGGISARRVFDTIRLKHKSRYYQEEPEA